MYYNLINSMSRGSATSSIVTSGLILNLDAGNPLSYSGSGTTWTDLSTSSNNSVLTNGVSYNSANSGSLIFDGVNDYTISNNNIGITLNQSRTIDIWFKVSNLTSRKVLCSFGTYDTRKLCNLEINSIMGTNYPYFAGFSNDAYISETIPINTWYNLSFTYNSGDFIDGVDGIKMYLNGVQKTISFPFGNLSLQTGDSKFYVGYEGAGARNPMTGNIGAVHVYNTALTSSDILVNFNALKSRYGL